MTITEARHKSQIVRAATVDTDRSHASFVVSLAG